MEKFMIQNGKTNMRRYMVKSSQPGPFWDSTPSHKNNTWQWFKKGQPQVKANFLIILTKLKIDLTYKFKVWSLFNEYTKRERKI